jgi:uncharacterized protein YmfQ (DUF2313 family)
MIVFRALEKLLPRGEAFKLTVEKVLTNYIRGIAAGAPEDFKGFAFLVWRDLFPFTTTQIEAWANQFGLFPNENEANQRQNVDAAWKSTGGQGLDYLQALIDAAGFNVTVHASLDPNSQTYRNPLNYLAVAANIGTIQCGSETAYCGSIDAYDSGLQGAIQDHIVNQDLSGRVQPDISNDPATFPFWIYVGGEVFGTKATIPTDREVEFQSLILSIFPGTYWIGYMIDKANDNQWDDAAIWDDSLIWNDDDFWGTP